MRPAEIRDLRSRTLKLTQAQFAQLLGVHEITVSKWERGAAEPTPYQSALMKSFSVAGRREPEVGEAVAGLLVAAGIGVALYHLLRAAFGKGGRA